MSAFAFEHGFECETFDIRICEHENFLLLAIDFRVKHGKNKSMKSNFLIISFIGLDKCKKKL